jgi:hypothetical protein
MQAQDLALFKAALGLTEPWQVTSVEFDPATKRLDLRIDFPRVTHGIVDRGFGNTTGSRPVSAAPRRALRQPVPAKADRWLRRRRSGSRRRWPPDSRGERRPALARRRLVNPRQRRDGDRDGSNAAWAAVPGGDFSNVLTSRGLVAVGKAGLEPSRSGVRRWRRSAPRLNRG